MSAWKKFRHRLEAAACRLLAWGIPRLSRSSCVRLAHALGEIAARLDFRGRAVGLANLAAAFGDRFTPAQRLEILRASYRNFARTMFDLFWAPALMQPKGRGFLRLQGWAEMKAKLAGEGRGAVLLTIHAGNWEWASLAAGLAELPCITVTETFKNDRLAAIFRTLRETTGQEITPQEGSMLRMLRAVKRGRCAALLTDLSFPPNGASTVINAWGLEMSVCVLHAVLAERTGCAVVPALTEPQADGGCLVRLCDPLPLRDGASLREIAQACWDFYEPHLSARPGLWLWPYKHFRYRPKAADPGRYPFYANASGAFEKLRRRELGTTRV